MKLITTRNLYIKSYFTKAKWILGALTNTQDLIRLALRKAWALPEERDSKREGGVLTGTFSTADFEDGARHMVRNSSLQQLRWGPSWQTNQDLGLATLRNWVLPRPCEFGREGWAPEKAADTLISALPESAQTPDRRRLWDYKRVLFETSEVWDFSGSSVVKTLYFQCRGQSFNPWLGK